MTRISPSNYQPMERDAITDPEAGDRFEGTDGGMYFVLNRTPKMVCTVRRSDWRGSGENPQWMRLATFRRLVTGYLGVAA